MAPPLNVSMAAFVGFKPAQATLGGGEQLFGDDLTDWLQSTGLMS